MPRIRKQPNGVLPDNVSDEALTAIHIADGLRRLHKRFSTAHDEASRFMSVAIETSDSHHGPLQIHVGFKDADGDFEIEDKQTILGSRLNRIAPDFQVHTVSKHPELSGSRWNTTTLKSSEPKDVAAEFVRQAEASAMTLVSPSVAAILNRQNGEGQAAVAVQPVDEARAQP